jgi:hypothetical protein
MRWEGGIVVITINSVLLRGGQDCVSVKKGLCFEARYLSISTLTFDVLLSCTAAC